MGPGLQSRPRGCLTRFLAHQDVFQGCFDQAPLFGLFNLVQSPQVFPDIARHIGQQEASLFRGPPLRQVFHRIHKPPFEHMDRHFHGKVIWVGQWPQDIHARLVVHLCRLPQGLMEVDAGTPTQVTHRFGKAARSIRRQGNRRAIHTSQWPKLFNYTHVPLQSR